MSSNVFSNKASLTLQPNQPQIYRGERVTVTCQIQGGGTQWTHEWRSSAGNKPPTSREYRIFRSTESDSGEYSCRGTSGFDFTEWSDVVTLTVCKLIIFIYSTHQNIDFRLLVVSSTPEKHVF
uniref:Ig-like domain-containing protein n=1 Tax=Kryptolebias marmoratus TaxID=37003 RepID=A0A3Q3AH09_KRYMA